MIMEEILPRRKMGENTREGLTQRNELLRGIGKSIGGDLNVDDKVSKWTVKLHHCFVGYQSVGHKLTSSRKLIDLPLHHCFIGYQSVGHKLTSSRKLIPASAIKNRSKNEEDAI
jgi:hypothetical protein